MQVQRIDKRLGALEGRVGGGGCRRCEGVLSVVRNVITGDLHSAKFNGESLSKEELRERESESRCPRCGRHLGNSPTIRVGGTPPRAGGEGGETHWLNAQA